MQLLNNTVTHQIRNNCQKRGAIALCVHNRIDLIWKYLKIRISTIMTQNPEILEY